jgi:acyl-coenzyme A synthetase/AMP-(fatty) acid ligase
MIEGTTPNSRYPVLQGRHPDQPIAFRGRQPISRREFLIHVASLARTLPAGAFMVNLCEERYRFLVAYAAAQSRGHTVLLPASRAERVVAEVEEAHPGSYRCDDESIEAVLCNAQASASAIEVAPAHVCMIGFTSGSTGQPKRFPKLWRSVSASTACNAARIHAALGQQPGGIVATVPPQHMYGMELSILLPLIGGIPIHSGRPLFPADIASALAEIPAPRILVSTPVHLRALVESSIEFPPTALMVCATAPLGAELARHVEARLQGQLLELFGSTETCVFAHRRTSSEHAWQLYDGVSLDPGEHGTIVAAPWYPEPVPLQDIVELEPGNRFSVKGRNADMIEVAGKRASLADLTARLLAIEGVLDAAVVQPDATSGGVRRVAALVVTSGLSAADVLERFRSSVDPAFLPRPLHVLPRLPRNELGKLPREALLDALRKLS